MGIVKTPTTYCIHLTVHSRYILHASVDIAIQSDIDDTVDDAEMLHVHVHNKHT